MMLHGFNRRILAEELIRLRRPNDLERYAASQRQARIDPNPHQIDAVIFALRRLREQNACRRAHTSTNLLAEAPSN